jgi:YesN/AraC family two-component response regulator
LTITNLNINFIIIKKYFGEDIQVKKILLVEDEPSAMRHLKTIIETKCKNFLIIGEAENGKEAIEIIKKYSPDIVITDVKMPLMDGIELVSYLKSNFPDIYSIIISGYQDFEYAKGAIKSGVVDYLLKPVNIKQLKEILDSIYSTLEKNYNEVRIDILKKLISSCNIEKHSIEKYFKYKFYQVAIIREKGLPSRYISTIIEEKIEDFCEKSNEKLNFDYCKFTNRDEKEFIYVFGTDNKKDDIKDFLLKEIKNFKNTYTTAVYDKRYLTLKDLSKAVNNLYYFLSEKLVIGYSQFLLIDGEKNNFSKEKITLDETLINRTDYLVSNAMYSELKNEVIKLFENWEKEKKTQLFVENFLNQIFNLLMKYQKTQSEVFNIDFELEQSMFYSNSFGELMADTWELISRIIDTKSIKNTKVDTPEFIESIENYLKNNLSRNLSLKNVCHTFGISQTYLSRLFKKYKKMSFGEYLTDLRIKKAKELIDENPMLHLKDISELVGYSDQFYFSKVFRLITGMPPSDYSKKKNSKK